MSSGSDAETGGRRRGDPRRRRVGVRVGRSADHPMFFLACVALAIALLYLIILALAGASIAAALPLVMMTTFAGVLALYGWQRDRSAAEGARLRQERAELHNRRLRRQLVELYRAREALADPSDVPAMIVQIAASLLEAEKGLLLAPAEYGQRPSAAAEDWATVATIGFSDDAARAPVVLELAAVALREQQAARADRLAPGQSPRLVEGVDELRSLVALPIYVSDVLLGVVVCANRSGGFADFDDDVLLALGDQAGAVLENGRMQSELRDSYVSVVRMLAETIKVKDPDLRSHSEEVSDYVVGVARRLGVEATDRERLRFGSLLHDVGKIAISEQILLKPGPLDEEEWRQIRLHPVIGARLLRQVPSVAPLADAVLHHHERWDGSGYPEGLKESAIPLEARIIAVADSFSAMTADRPYRRTMTVAEACAELERCAGSWYDSTVVGMFVAEVRERPPRRRPQPVAEAIRGLQVTTPGVGLEPGHSALADTASTPALSPASAPTSTPA